MEKWPLLCFTKSFLGVALDFSADTKISNNEQLVAQNTKVWQSVLAKI